MHLYTLVAALAASAEGAGLEAWQVGVAGAVLPVALGVQATLPQARVLVRASNQGHTLEAMLYMTATNTESCNMCHGNRCWQRAARRM